MASVTVLGNPSIFAAVRTWTGASSTYLWSDPANWAGGTAPAAGDDLVFPSSAPLKNPVNDIAPGTEFNSITLNQPDISLTGNEVGLGGGGITSTLIIPANVYLPITLAASQTWNAGRVVILGQVNLNNHSLTLDGDDTNMIIIGPVVGSGDIVQLRGTVSYQGNNTFTGTYTNKGGGVSVVFGRLSVPYVQTAGGLSFSSNATVGDVDIQGGTLAPGNGSSGAIGNSGNVSLKPGVKYFEAANLSDPTTVYGSMHVTGTVNLNSATLQFFSSDSNQVVGQHLVIIDNDGSDPVVGTFAGLPEGSIFGTGRYRYAISYVGESGNDVVLTVLALTKTTVQSSLNPSIFQQSVTFTAHVTADSGLPTGSVTFSSGGLTLGSAMVDNTGTATLATTILPTGTYPIIVDYSGGGLFAPSTSLPIFQQVVSSAIPAVSRWGLFVLSVVLSFLGAVAAKQ